MRSGRPHGWLDMSLRLHPQPKAPYRYVQLPTLHPLNDPLASTPTTEC